MKRADARKGAFAIQLMPRSAESSSEYQMAWWLGDVLEEATQANGGVPPLTSSYDWHSSHGLLNRVYLGLASATQMDTLPFFKECVIVPIHLPCFPYGSIKYLDQGHVFGHNDCPHGAKRLSIAENAGSNNLRMFDLLVDFSYAPQHGMPWAAYCHKNVQSDVEAHQFRNPAYVRELTWSTAGGFMMLFVDELMVSPWLTTDAFTPEEMAHNALVGYYLCLLNMAAQHEKYGTHTNHPVIQASFLP